MQKKRSAFFSFIIPPAFYILHFFPSFLFFHSSLIIPHSEFLLTPFPHPHAPGPRAVFRLPLPAQPVPRVPCVRSCGPHGCSRHAVGVGAKKSMLADFPSLTPAPARTSH